MKKRWVVGAFVVGFAALFAACDGDVPVVDANGAYEFGDVTDLDRDSVGSSGSTWNGGEIPNADKIPESIAEIVFAEPPASFCFVNVDTIFAGESATWYYTSRSGKEETFFWVFPNGPDTSSTDTSVTITYPYGGQYSGKVIVKFKGDTSSVEIVCANVANVIGDPAPEVSSSSADSTVSSSSEEAEGSSSSEEQEGSSDSEGESSESSEGLTTSSSSEESVASSSSSEGALSSSQEITSSDAVSSSSVKPAESSSSKEPEVSSSSETPVASSSSVKPVESSSSEVVAPSSSSEKPVESSSSKEPEVSSSSEKPQESSSSEKPVESSSSEKPVESSSSEERQEESSSSEVPQQSSSSEEPAQSSSSKEPEVPSSSSEEQGGSSDSAGDVTFSNRDDVMELSEGSHTLVMNLSENWHGSTSGTCTLGCDALNNKEASVTVNGTTKKGYYITFSLPITSTINGYTLNVTVEGAAKCQVKW
ncbi:MAG: hypothetical protein MJY47_06935 [Fibrobacter sp.]|nr:hypothetical protein [Fibrobacter sp.]